MSGEGSLSAKRKQQQTSPSRKRRSDAGTAEFNERDEYALTWIGLQYGIRLDHLQWLLGRFPGKDAAHSNWISEGAARDVVERWKLGKWVQQARIRAHEPFWVWPTRLGLRKIGLPYSYRDLARTGLDDLNHLYAMNEIRIHLGDDEEGTQWISERQLLQGLIRDKGRDLLHRPDAEIHWADGQIFAVEAELSTKKPFELAENVMELLRGEDYLRLKAAYGWRTARTMSQGARSRYAEIWYFAPRTIRKQVRRERARLVERGDLSKQEARRLFLRWYPLAETDEEVVQEEQEDEEAIYLSQEEIDLENRDRDEARSLAEKEDRE